MPRIIALVPARGGSKGVPRKNLETVGGLSLVERTIRHALAVTSLDGIYVSTEDAEIAEIARGAGASVLARPIALAGDVSTTESVITHALEVLERAGEAPDIVVLLQCTSPFRSPGQLQRALDTFETRGCDSMLSVCRFHGFLWSKAGVGGGYRANNYSPADRPRRQDLDDSYLETGSFYIFRRSLFESVGVRLGGHVEVFVVPESDALEIDDPQQLEQARRIADDEALSLPPGDLSRLRWLILDVDGTLTDGAMYYGEDGSEQKRFDTGDGMGIARWKAAGGKVAFITGENSQAARRRGEKLQIDHIVLGCKDKSRAIRELCRRFETRRCELVAMGDDINDLPMADEVAMFAAPANAQPQVCARADAVTRRSGGHGAVRELIEDLLFAGALASTHDAEAIGRSAA